jgi:hypothetical protein
VARGKHSEAASSWLDRREFAWPIGVASALLLALAFWPGVRAPDPNGTILQAELGDPTDWWTPFGAIALRAWRQVGLDLGAAYGVLILLNVVGAYLCLRVALRRVPAAIATWLLIAFPPIHAQLSIISRDGFGLGLVLTAVGLMAAQERVDTTRRRWLIIGAFAAAIAAGLCRQNYFVLVVVFAAYLVLRGSAVTRRGAGKAIAIGLAAGIVVLGVNSIAQRVFSVKHVHPERASYLYDLAAISVNTDENQFPKEMKRGPRPGWISKDVGQVNLERRFSTADVYELLKCDVPCSTDPFSERIAKRESDLLRDAWVASVTSHPLEYAHVRLRLLQDQMGIGWRTTDSQPAFLYDPSNSNTPLRFTSGFDLAHDYEAVFVGRDATIPLDLPWLYQLLVIVLGVAILRRERTLMSAAGVTAFLLLSFSLLNLAGVFLTAPAAAFRYLLPNVSSALILGAIWLAGLAVVQARAGTVLSRDDRG